MNCFCSIYINWKSCIVLYISTKLKLAKINPVIQTVVSTIKWIIASLQVSNRSLLISVQKRCARWILDSPRDTRSYDNFQKLKWLPVDQLFKLNKFGLLKKGTEILNYNLGLTSVWTQVKYQNKTIIPLTETQNWSNEENILFIHY